MKVEIKRVVPEPPPEVVVITLSIEEARGVLSYYSVDHNGTVTGTTNSTLNTLLTEIYRTLKDANGIQNRKA